MINKLSIPFILLTGALFYLPVFAQEVPSPQQALQNFGIDAAQIAELERGKIIAYEVSETSQKELAIGVAMILPVACLKSSITSNVANLRLPKLTLSPPPRLPITPTSIASRNSHLPISSSMKPRRFLKPSRAMNSIYLNQNSTV